MRNNSYSTTPFTNTYQSPSPTFWSNLPTLQTPPPPPLTSNNGQTSIQQFLNSDMLASMSRSNSQPDLTATLSPAQSSANQLTSSKSMSVCSDDLYMDIGGCNNSSVVDDLFLGIEADFIGTSDLSDFFEIHVHYFNNLLIPLVHYKLHHHNVVHHHHLSLNLNIVRIQMDDNYQQNYGQK
jgi:hypothetical protein